MLANGIILSSLAGMFAGLAAVFSKLALDDSKFSQDWEYQWRICFIGMVVVCNVLMWLLFVRSLHSVPSVVIAMIFNTTTNFITTGFLGYFIFQEEVKINWFLGILCMMLGIVFLKLGIIEKENIN